MGHWEAEGASDEWYTPKYIFDALGCRFDLDESTTQALIALEAARDELTKGTDNG